MLIKVLFCITIGIVAGAGTGLAGISAAMVISPILIAYLGFPVYEAIGIALGVDVFSSATSSVTFIKRKKQISRPATEFSSALWYSLPQAACFHHLCPIPFWDTALYYVLL